jgi:hypothetical protein
MPRKGWSTSRSSGRLLGRLDGEFGNGSSSPAFVPGIDAIVATCREDVEEPFRPYTFLAWKPGAARLVLCQRSIGGLEYRL